MEKPRTINASQWKAVCQRGSHLLIVAGPGTGKTHTLIHRIEHIRKDLTSGQKNLAITFTHKAADEMQERLEAQFSEPDERIFVGTFHRFCLVYLRQHASETNLPARFGIAGEEDTADAARQLWPSAGTRERKKKLEEISRWKASRFLEEPPPEVSAYNVLLRANGLLDYDDLLIETIALLARQARCPYAFIFVDEYQDINALQQALLKRLVGPGVFLTAIGDPNQSIYGFRGAQVRFFKTFTEDFPGAETIVLSDNYRSSPNLLKACGQVAAKGNSFGLPPLTAQIYTQGRLVIHGASSDKAEAEYVVRQIEKMVGGTSLFSRDSGRVIQETEEERGFGDIAVLYRLNVQRKVLEEALFRHGIPYEVSGDKPFGQQRPVGEWVEALMGQEQIFGGGKSLVHAVEEIGGMDVWRRAFERHPEWGENFQKFKRMCCRCGTMEELADHLALQRPEDALDRRAEKVHLLTLHASKGLEFGAVFITGCEERLAPLDFDGMVSDPEEERRLFYVGMTRAKRSLFLTHAGRRRIFGVQMEQRPSRYLQEDIENQLKEYEQTLPLKKQKARRLEHQMDLFKQIPDYKQFTIPN
jgi:superfamily I DNA/RNA helicase